MAETPKDNFPNETHGDIIVSNNSEERGESMAATRNSGLNRCINLSPIFFVFILVAWTYASFTLWSFKSIQSNLYATLICLAFYHFFLVMMITSYVKCIITDPGTVPSVFLEKFSHGNEQQDHPIDIDKCRKCGAKRPERSHHCSTCKRCILKMDHHCPWINNCVGFRNHKYFMLFLTYTVLLSIVIVASLAWWIKDNLLKTTISFVEIQIFSSFLISLVFGLVLTMFTSTHYRYILCNVTTLEHIQKRRLWKRRRKQLLAIKDARNLSESELNELKGKFSRFFFPSLFLNESPYDVGARKNFEQVFGVNPLLWFIPVNREISGLDGTFWPTSEPHESEEARSLLEESRV